MLKYIYVLSAVIVASAAHAQTKTVLVNPGQTKTIAQPHANGAHCTTGQVKVSVTKSPKLGSISVSDKKVKGCNGKRISFRPTGKGKDSATIKVTFPNGSATTTKYKLKIK